jgi:hypothetical protein
MVWFVDFEDFRRARQISTRRRMMNLVHLDHSIGRFASRSKRLRFFDDYFGGKPPRQEARRLHRQYEVVRSRAEARGHRPAPIQVIAPVSPFTSK